MTLATNAFQLVQTFPREYRYGLSNQIINAAVSIPSNVAEGNSRSSDKDKARFIEIALGSAFEFETQILIAESFGLGNDVIRKLILRDIQLECIMLHSFLGTLKN